MAQAPCSSRDDCWPKGRTWGGESQARPQLPAATPVPPPTYRSTSAGGRPPRARCAARGRSLPRRRHPGFRVPPPPASASPLARCAGLGSAPTSGRESHCRKRAGAQSSKGDAEGQRCWGVGVWAVGGQRKGETGGQQCRLTSGEWVNTCCFWIWKERKCLNFGGVLGETLGALFGFFGSYWWCSGLCTPSSLQVEIKRSQQMLESKPGTSPVHSQCPTCCTMSSKASLLVQV